MKLCLDDLGVVTGELKVFCSSLSDFFRNKTWKSMKQVLQYLQGLILLNERGNMTSKRKAELGLKMLLKTRELGVPFAWVCMNCFYGQLPWFLASRDRESFLYIADVPSDTKV